MTTAAKPTIPVSGKTKDISFIAALLRARNIPYRQAPVFAHAPILLIPEAHATALHAILGENRAAHPVHIVDPAELKRATDMFKIMVVAAIGILCIAWGRYLFKKF